MKNTYLGRLKRQSKGLYRLILAFIAGSLLLIQTKYNPPFMFAEMTPFFTWGMFSTDLVPEEHQHYTFYVLKYNGQTFNLPTYQDHRKIFFQYTIPQYDMLSAHQYQDPALDKYNALLARLKLSPAYALRIGNTTENIQQYPQWLKRYMSANTGTHIQHLEVLKYWVHFDNKATLITDSSKVIIHE